MAPRLVEPPRRLLDYQRRRDKVSIQFLGQFPRQNKEFVVMDYDDDVCFSRFEFWCASNIMGMGMGDSVGRRFFGRRLDVVANPDVR